MNPLGPQTASMPCRGGDLPSFHTGLPSGQPVDPLTLDPLPRLAWLAPLGLTGHGLNVLFEAMLASSSCLVAGSLGLLAWKRRDLSLRWTAFPVSLAFLAFGLMHAAQALGFSRPGNPIKALAALASVCAALLIAWVIPRLLAVPTLDQVRAQAEARLQAKEALLSVERQEHEARLQRQKLEALGILAGGLAHDFNNLLGAMAGNVELAQLETGRGGAVQPYLQTLEGLVDRSATLVQQILAYSGRGKTQVLPLDLNEQMTELTRLMRATLARKPTLRLEPQPGLPAIRGDLAQIQQVIMNLVINASEAVAPVGGVIILRTGTENLEQAELDRDFPGQRLAPGPQVFLEVADNGAGMPPEVLRRIFDPFFTTKFTGRGLGLSAIQGIVRSHHGGIRVHSEPGLGTAFKVLFPAAPEPPAALPPEPPPFEAALAAYAGTGTILVVDDEAPLRSIAVKALQVSGFETLEAGDGLEALRLFETRQSDIRLVLLDLTMPRMDGEEAYRVLRRSGILVPVILTSGFSKLEVLQHFQGKGIAGFLQKPYKLQTLLAKIRMALDGQEDGDTSSQREPLAWEQQYETGVEILDQQHRNLLDLYNRLVKAVQALMPVPRQVEIFQALKEATLTNFLLEDSLMLRSAYPLRKPHQESHIRLIAQVQEVAARVQVGKLSFTAPVLDFLEGWVVHHMQEEDVPLGRYLRGVGH